MKIIDIRFWCWAHRKGAFPPMNCAFHDILEYSERLCQELEDYFMITLNPEIDHSSQCISMAKSISLTGRWTYWTVHELLFLRDF